MNRLVVPAILIISAAATAPAAAAQRAAESNNPRVDSIFAQWDSDDSPGCALGVYRDGRIVYARGYGMADLERHVPITPQTVFDIGSTSKQFSAASILLLAQQGKLSLDDDVRRHVPELPEYSAPITIRHLLLHTSGLRDYIGLLTLAGARIDDVTTPQDALDIIARQKELNFEPGAEHLYSNSGYFLLSVIVERVAGMSLRDFARTQIFEPLGMTRTHYLGSYDDIVPDRALAYAPRGDGYRTDISRWLQLGDGAVFTNVEELLHWDANFYDPKVGGQTMLEQLQTTGRLNSGSALTYALGLSIGDHRGQRTVSHGGAWGGYRAELLRFPDQHFSVATLCNLGTTNPSMLARRVANVFLEDVFAPAAAGSSAPAARPATDAPVAATPKPAAAAVEVPEAVLSELAGTWRTPATRSVRTLVLDGGKLYLQAGGARYEVRPHSATQFRLVDAPAEVTLAFSTPASGPRRMTWAVPGQDTLVFEKLTLVTPTAAELEAYAGSYHSDELEATFRIVAEGGELTLHRRGASPQEMRPMERDEFSVGSMSLTFSRGADGRPSGYRLDIGRIRNLLFTRMEDAGPH